MSEKTNIIEPWALHWFRRDLRVAGNPALQHSFKEFKGRVVGLFCFDSTFLARSDFSANRFAFFLESLKALRAELRELGSDLLVLDLKPDLAFKKLFSALNTNLPKSVSYNRDYEPFARARDTQISTLLNEQFGIKAFTARDHLLFEPDEISRQDSSGFYQVYTPFAKRWFDTLKSVGNERIAAQASALKYLEQSARGKAPTELFKLRWSEILGNSGVEFADKLEEFIALNKVRVTVPIPAAGSLAAYRTLKNFAGERLMQYKAQRDFPALSATSQLSIYFKNGSLTTAQVIAFLELNKSAFETSNGASTFLKEIVWREFYYHIIYHRPEVEKQSFREKYINLKWENDLQLFEAWKEGRTGYPIVDAGMRELNSTGRMHNRVRMIVASFLCKHLLIDWRWGEQYFMQYLLDGDLAPNNGGWQWAASTGCDAQPYFRIFNPDLQSKKFDSNGDYIKKFVPELRSVPAKLLHIAEECNAADYPKPIVEHKIQRMRALELYNLNQ